MNLAMNYQPTEIEIFQSGWAQRMGHGQLYRHSYMNEYSPLLKEYFELGKNESSTKMNAGQMREALKVKYPLRFSIPGETEIKSYIGVQF